MDGYMDGESNGSLKSSKACKCLHRKGYGCDSECKLLL